MDENPAFDVNRRFLQEKYVGIQDFYRISCKERDGIDNFSLALQRAITQVEIHQTTWGIAWFKVKARLEQMTEPFIVTFLCFCTIVCRINILGG